MPHRKLYRQQPPRISAVILRADKSDMRGAMNPLTGIWGTCVTAPSYLASAPNGAGDVGSRATVHCSLLSVHWTYTFSAKEKDPETSLSYFGSRYYSSDLSIWLSVDPMSDKYASLSPYTYCANNPVILVDPNGDTVIVTGADADSYVQGLNTENLTFSRNESGYVSYQGTAKTSLENRLVSAIESPNIFVNICAENTNSIDNVGGVPSHFQTNGGSFLGTVYENGIVNTYQQVNPAALEKVGDDIGVGRGMYEWHEMTESFEAGIISLDYKYSSPRANMVGSVYNAAHDRASFAYDLDCVTINCKIPFFDKNGRTSVFKYKNVTIYKYSIHYEE